LNILVTGASGFIGHHVIDAVQERGWTACPLLRLGSDSTGLEPFGEGIRRADLRDEKALEAAVEGIDGIVHLAGLTRARSQKEFRDVNAAGVGRIVRAARRGAPGLRRFLYVSSLAAAGPSTVDGPRLEDAPPAPVTAYGRSKLEGEQVLRDEALDLPWTIVRPPIVYGPWERDLLTIFRLCRRGVVPVLGFRPKSYSIVFAPDFARHVVALMDDDRAVGETYFLAEPRAYSYQEIVVAIGQAVGRVPPLLRVPHLVARLVATGGSAAQFFSRRPPMLTLGKLPEVLASGWVCGTEKARAVLGEVGPTTLAEGAILTAAWYRDRGWM
jgi:nucleoside-diphosphate-sugar epimerase